MKIANNQIERKKAIKFLRAMLDENVNWQKYIGTVENKIAKKSFHKYPQNFQERVLASKNSSSMAWNVAFLFRGPKIWNDFLTNEEKEKNA